MVGFEREKHGKSGEGAQFAVATKDTANFLITIT